MRRLCLAMFLVLSILLPSTARSQANSTTLSGNVMTAEGNRRVEGARIRLCDDARNLIQESVTTSSGSFGFGRLRRAQYIVTVAADGFEPTELHADLSFSSQRGITIYLKSLAKEKAPDSSGPSVSAHELSLPEDARDLLHSGRKALYAEKNPTSALKRFDRALKKAPDCYEAEYGKGIAYVTLRQMPEAEHSFREALKKSKDKYGDAEIALGTLLLDDGQLADGEKRLRHGIELSPGSWMGFYQIAKFEVRTGRFTEAETSAGQARSLAPNVAQVHQLLSVIHLRLKNYPALLKDIDSYLQLDSTSPAAQRAKQVRVEVEQQIARSTPAPEPAPQTPPQED
jgi:tetratricopeptide (TPR) repeat protein